jgi:hypothetical protein
MTILTIMRNRTIEDPHAQAESLSLWPSGTIRMASGQLLDIRCGILPKRASVARVWLASRFRSLPEDHCSISYHSPLLGRYLALDSVFAGPNTSYRTLRGACEILDEVARLRGAVAIFAHVSNSRISDRLLRRFGWLQHPTQSPGRHWIKRFYDGYPGHDLRRYLRNRQATDQGMLSSVR